MANDNHYNFEFYERLLEIYTLSDILEICDLTESEAIHLLSNMGAIDLDKVPA